MNTPAAGSNAVVNGSGGWQGAAGQGSSVVQSSTTQKGPRAIQSSGSRKAAVEGTGFMRQAVQSFSARCRQVLVACYRPDQV